MRRNEWEELVGWVTVTAVTNEGVWPGVEMRARDVRENAEISSSCWVWVWLQSNNCRDSLVSSNLACG